MSLFGNFSFSRLLNRQFTVKTTADEIGEEDKKSFLGVENCTFLPGLGFADYYGLNSASRSGWIMSLSSVMKHFDDDEMYMKIHKKGRECEGILKNVLIGILSSERRRNDSTNVYFHQTSEEDRYEMAKALMESLFTNNKSSSKKQGAFDQMINVGVVSIEIKRPYERNTDEFDKLAKDFIKKIAEDTGFVIPVVVTAATILKMSTKSNLLKEEEINDTIDFHPSVGRMSSTHIYPTCKRV